MTAKRVKILIFAALLVLISSMAIGGYEKDKPRKPGESADKLYREVELFADALTTVRSQYVDEIDSKKLIYGAMRGMLASLDDFSAFLEPDEYDEIKMETKGEFGGVGIEVSCRDGIITVVTPIVGTPAESAGIKPNDKIVKIDGVTMKDVTLSDAVKKLRGKPGETVTLTIWRESTDKILDIKIKRALIKIRSIKRSELIQDKIGYIKLVEFQEKTARDLDEAIKKLESQGMNALVLDLRNNPGGLLDGAVDVSERFLAKDKMIVSLKSRNPGENLEFKSSGKFTRADYPLVIMVNEGSASASEIVAGAVQDNKRGVVLGEKTFGKASVQSVIPLRDGSALKITSASYYTPSGKLIRNQGINPDVVVALEEPKTDKEYNSEEIFEKAEPKGNIEDKNLTAIDLMKNDKQLAMAVDLIKAIKIYKESEKR